MVTISQVVLFLALLVESPVVSFIVGTTGASSYTTTTTTTTTISTAIGLRASSTATETDVTKPSYEIEPIPIRIGHGFDIHRMAPIEEAGQPVVIGGVEITHKDQMVKYNNYLHSCFCFSPLALFFAAWMANTKYTVSF